MAVITKEFPTKWAEYPTPLLVLAKIIVYFKLYK
jgi:hypothetical protein